MQQSNASWKQWSSHPALLLLLCIPLSSALHTSCYSIAYVIPTICICQYTPLAFEGLLSLACNTIKKKHRQLMFSKKSSSKKRSLLAYLHPYVRQCLSATRLHAIQQPKEYCCSENALNTQMNKNNCFAFH